MLGRKVFGVYDFEGMIEHALGDEIRVEFASRRVAVMRGQHLGEGRGTVEVQAITAARAEQKFCYALEVEEVGDGGGMVLRKNFRIEMGNIGIVLFEGHPNPERLSGGSNTGPKRAVSEDGGPKRR